jgi:hypothetical protein
LPPEERFWQRYSPHNEFPLSSLGSVTIYVLLIVLIIAGIKLKLFESASAPLPVGAVEFDPNVGGGGGEEQGVKGGTGDKLPDQVGDVTKLDPNLPKLPDLNLPKEELDPNKLPDILRPEKQDEGITDYTESISRLAKLEQGIQKNLIESMRDKGKGGDGTGGGQGDGQGTGTGDARGSGNKKAMDERVKRMLRWNLVFDTRNGEDYRLQLQSLGAIVAIPTGPDQYMVLKDLRPGAKPAQEDLKNMNRIWWVDNREQSVGNLARALQLPAVPTMIIAFFPKELEDKLAHLEEAFARRSGGAGKNIKETRFRIVLNGRTGKYEPMLVDQR